MPIGEAAKFLGVSIQTLRRWDKAGVLSAFKPSESGNRYYKEEALIAFLNEGKKVNIVELGKKWARVSKAPLLSKEYWCPGRDIFQARLQTFQVHAKQSELNEQSSLLTAIIGEIGNNSFDHNLGNWRDQQGIYFAYDLKKLTIILADRGQGILATLKKVKPSLKTHKQALQIAFTEIISGRAPESRGNGLKFVRKSMHQLPLNLHFQTGNALFTIEMEQESFSEEESNIRGCFVHISL
jgi:hypothetical protein